MKRIATILLVAVTITGCATRPTGQNPFASLEPARVAKIQVGELSVNPETARSSFTQYFEITDPNIISRLVGLTGSSPHKTDGWPGIGMLSYQRFVDFDGRVVADTRIVNFDNTVVIHEPNMPMRGYWKCMRSPEFCRTIYDLMLKYIPEEIESQRRGYREVGQELELLLFEGKQNKRTAQPQGRGYSPPAARSAQPTP